jgi:hypothetical protein
MSEEVRSPEPTLPGSQDRISMYLGVMLSPFTLPVFGFGFYNLWKRIDQFVSFCLFYIGVDLTKIVWITHISSVIVTVGVVLLAIVYGSAIEVLEKPHPKSRLKKVSLIVTIIITASLNIISLLYVVYTGSIDTFHFWVNIYQRYLQSFVEKYQLQVLASLVLTLVTIVFTTFAYRMRCRRRLIYGIVEFLFGVLAIIYSTDSALTSILKADAPLLTPSDRYQALFQFFAGIYITVRGLTNVEDGINQQIEQQKIQPSDRLLWLNAQNIWKRLFYGPTSESTSPGVIDTDPSAEPIAQR